MKYTGPMFYGIGDPNAKPEFTDWTNIGIAAPENLTEKVGGKKETKKLIRKQKTIGGGLSTASSS